MSDPAGIADHSPAPHDRDVAARPPGGASVASGVRADLPQPGGIPAIRAHKLLKTYEGGAIRAVDEINFAIYAGQMAAVVGPSGCGKSTLLNLIAGMDRPDAGELTVFGHSIAALDAHHLDEFRAATIGFVFQLHNLLPHLTAHENVQIPMIGRALSPRQRAERASELLERVGLGHRMRNRPTQLSGGERQRVAIARALANRPRLILADEPTGALDTRNGQHVLTLLREIQRDEGVTLLIVTHDVEVAESASRILHMRDGRMTDSERTASPAA